ncbi:hypothetical protein DM860_008299 [Cuscuta australis]|uniref:YqgF/RNase H-like domain-containing protein n=2 Tax=Cuscuta sect. Cleistogrammica TaxID=1824901 RepID=A0A328D732_9ASTE|nr:hypothetical protein DM860_008299 [Cuscuta australis]
MGTAKLRAPAGFSLSIPQSPEVGKCLNLMRLTRQSTRVKQAVTIDEIPPNSLMRARDPCWSSTGFSLGVDLGSSRTGLAISKGFSFRPLMVLGLRGQKLEDQLIDIAQKQEVDEFIVGLPLSSDRKETPQSNKVRSVVGRLAVRAAERGWRVYLQDEYGTSSEAMDHMITMGLGRSTRQEKCDAYAAVMLLERYFSMSGDGVELVVPKQPELQIKLRKASSIGTDVFLD